MTQTNNRLLTSAKVALVLAKAGIPALGANKLPVLSRTGNQFVRKDGTAIRIFNVLAFRSIDEQNQAVASWKEGTRIEKSGDAEGAQAHFKAAYNMLMSFSVLEENAAAYENAYEVTARVEEVPAGAELQATGVNTVIGLNNVRPVAVSSNIATRENLFVYEEPKTAKAKTVKGAKAAA
jgi:hypothetical protein